MPKVTQYVSVIGSAIVSLATAFENLSPVAKSFFATELSVVEGQFSTVKTALENFATSSTIGKVASGLSLLNVFGAVILAVENIATQAEAQFASDWATIKSPINDILGLFGKSLPAASTPTATLPASVTAEPGIGT